MGFDGRFTLGLVFRVALLVLALMMVVWAFRTPSFVMVRLVAVGIAGLAALALWYHVERTNLALARFLEALRIGDFAAHFPEKGGAGFRALGTALNETIRGLREQRGQTDAELRYYEALIDDMPVALLTVDAGRVEPGNKAARRLFSRHAGVRPDDYATYGATFAQRLAEPRGDEEMLILNLDGRAKRTLVRHAALNRLGRQTSAVVVQPMQGTLDAVEMAAQTDIVRVLTHEILNSLTPVMSLAQTTAALLGEVEDGDPRIADACEATRALARRTEGLRHFIDSYRAVAREPRVVRQRFAARAFADEHERLFRAEWPAVTLHADCADTTIDGDRALLSQLLLNLLRNAAQAAKAHAAQPKIRLAIERTADGIAITVEDNGPGVPDKLRQEVFLPFFTTRAEGTGVGLNLARQIAVAHGGTLDVADSPLGGALFRLLL
ncbi:sensor histidine kinase [Sphingomonas sp. NBWT7]|uniref:sensor histidine kinase n=1 Tax=Sphingomonas sp. NBWT7 TaxID=2596913 RepID=UPI00162514A3|nr:ATP-binding protein [Sphingomonas sp. NBWT7]QNE31894.1 sensor histidine kinase [Sphingomonas sp. NBWT7]